MNTQVHRLVGGNALPLRTRVIKNSEVIKEGDWVTDESTGMANLDATSEKVAGFAKHIVTKDRINLEARSVDTGALGGTWASSTKQYTAAADNVTVDGVLVEYVPVLEGMRFKATLDAAKGTTTGSNKEGYFIAASTTDSSKLDESTASTSAASCQFRIVDPLIGDSTTEVVVEVIARQTSQFTMD